MTNLGIGQGSPIQECPAGAKSDTAVTSPPVAAGGA